MDPCGLSQCKVLFIPYGMASNNHSSGTQKSFCSPFICAYLSFLENCGTEVIKREYWFQREWSEPKLGHHKGTGGFWCLFPWAMGVGCEFCIKLPTGGWREHCSRNGSSESQESETSFGGMSFTESAPNINRKEPTASNIFTWIQPIEQMVVIPSWWTLSCCQRRCHCRGVSCQSRVWQQKKRKKGR